MKGEIGVNVIFFIYSTLNEGTHRSADFRLKKYGSRGYIKL